jgi:hypothetical protein
VVGAFVEMFHELYKSPFVKTLLFDRSGREGGVVIREGGGQVRWDLVGRGGGSVLLFRLFVGGGYS